MTDIAVIGIDKATVAQLGDRLVSELHVRLSEERGICAQATGEEWELSMGVEADDEYPTSEAFEEALDTAISVASLAVLPRQATFLISYGFNQIGNQYPTMVFVKIALSPDTGFQSLESPI